jgi:O-methyltransferase involved in polyketide biosynthesis
MSSVSDRLPPEIDADRPNAARIYDYFLGGAHNFAADRAAANALLRAAPDAPLVGQSNRAFLQRAVRHCVQQGITQFLDLGSGIPTVGNVHEIAHQLDPACRVVYVDNDPVSVGTTLQILHGVPNAVMVDADMRNVGAVLGDPQTRQMLDFAKPIALMMVAVLHYVSPGDDVDAIVQRYTAALAPGSLLVVSHTTWDPRPEVAAAVKKVFDETATPVTHRSREEIEALFSGLELVEPGVVWTPQWHPSGELDPEGHPERSLTFAAAGRVR